MRLILKIAMVFAMTLVLMIPVAMVNDTVGERQQYRRQAVEEVARSAAGPQSLQGPVLLVPYSDRVTVFEADDRGVKREVEQTLQGMWVFFPETLDVKGTLEPRTVYRGLHAVRRYELAAVMGARFRAVIPRDDDPTSPRTIGRPILGVGIADVRGLVGAPSIRMDGRAIAVAQGLGIGDASGLHARLAAPAEGSTLAFTADVRATLEGMEGLRIAPLGDRTRIEVDSRWPHPQFNGDFLPRSRTITASGFRATWDLNALASDAQGAYRSQVTGGRTPEVQAVGVSLVDPVDVYARVDRATKYGLLFVLLTFVAFFMFEFLKQLRIHPIQYGLVGLAIALFFLLLLALSERIDFGIAYLVAAVACITLIGYYLGHVLGGWARGTGFAAMLATLYAALYGLLVSEDNAMVLGAGLLFAVLATVMVLTRKVDWYAVSASRPGPPPLP